MTFLVYVYSAPVNFPILTASFPSYASSSLADNPGWYVVGVGPNQQLIATADGFQPSAAINTDSVDPNQYHFTIGLQAVPQPPDPPKPPPPPDPPVHLPNGPTATGSKIDAGEVLHPGEQIFSPSNVYKLAYQHDSNLVLYYRDHAVWASNTSSFTAGVTVLQHDGRLAIVASSGEPVWVRPAAGVAESHLDLQDDGNVVIYDGGGRALWATGTQLPTGPTPVGPELRPGSVVAEGQEIRSSNGRYKLAYQEDANLVVYDGSHATWASNTAGRPIGACVMQTDGNLVMYVRGMRPIWASNTSGHPGAHAVMQDDGNAVIYDTGGHALWATNTST